MTRRWRTIAALGLFALSYMAVWQFRRELQIVRPMANLRYFYYGTAPCTLSDRLLYWVFYPPHRASIAIQDLSPGRDDVHWSERDGGAGYEQLCEPGRHLGGQTRDSGNSTRAAMRVRG